MTKVEDLTVRLGAAAGDGIQSAGEILARILSRSGIYIYTYNGNQSVVRGGHVWFHIHAGNKPVYSMGYGIDYLVAFTQQSMDEHASEVNKGGAIIYDSSSVKPANIPEGIKAVPAELANIALKYDKYPIMKNTVSLGILAALMGIDFKIVEETIHTQFGKKKEDVALRNIQAATEGYQIGSKQERGKELTYDYSRRLPFLHSNYSFSLGAVAAGCRFYAAYPMTPASPIVHWLANHAEELGITVFLAEDEISAINAIIGASYAGARAMAGTSGGGFALMQEALGEAAMTETPIVVVDVMRAGPSTGLPTKTGQGDLNMMLGLSQDDFPRVIVAPVNANDAYSMAIRSFDISDRYQVPVIVLMDFAIGDGAYITITEDFSPAEINRGKLALQASGDMLNGTWFRRYQLTEDGVSPRSIPGTPGLMYVAKTDEHDEFGHDVSDVLAGLKSALKTREQMYEKRMKKLDYIRKEMRPPAVFGPSRADLTLITWGSSANPTREAIERLRGQGISVNSYEFTDIFPLNQEVEGMLKQAGRLADLEGNYTGQFANYLRRETGVMIKDRMLKYNGEPIYPAEVENFVMKVLGKEVQ
ncbi:MAG: 2-oxoacid:acceptor oxidoreductase subunit alpha [Nitrososphaerota archaeon]|nr:2-oxoacid:acceptor oxidoreductase subunit alpha [Nitrososphaerota archaeon]MDG6930717.1 2-oxoacid:acceptor oxidoreductase subunit alpha [Nitrososphaerota archaeon]